MIDDDDNDTLPPPKVTDAPAAIWLVYGEIEDDATHWECARNGDVGWCEDKQFDCDVEYVRADTIEAQAERIRVLREALEVARQFMAIASDWNMDEAELNGEMRSTYDWIEVIDTALEATK